MKPGLRVLLASMALALAPGAAPGEPDPDGPADAIGGGDLVVYSDGTDIRSSYYGAPLPNPYCDGLDCPGFDWRDDLCARSDDCTRVVLKDAPGIHNPAGTYAWQTASWGRYVFTTNYPRSPLIPHPTGSQGIGVFDSESQHFCALPLDPRAHHNGAVQMVGAADPSNPRRSRIYFEGVVNPLGPDPGYSFGWIEAEAGRDPCVPFDPGSPTAGWRVVGFSAAELNARAPAAWPAEKLPCDPEGDFPFACGWDGMSVLDPETVVLGNWWRRSLVVVRVPASHPVEDVRVVASHRLPLYRPADQPDMCYELAPVNRGQADPTRSPADRRVSWAFDVHCNFAGDVLRDNGCSFVQRCAYSLEACGELGAACAPFVFGDLVLDQACVPFHPMQRCARSGRSCNRGFDLTCGPGDECICDSGPKPAQEYRLDGDRLEPVGPLFRPGPLATSGGAATGATPLFYDASGSAWFGANAPGLPSAPHSLVVYGRDSSGEHGYTDPETAGSGFGVDVPPSDVLDQVFPTRQWNSIAGIASGARLGRTAWVFGSATQIEQLTLEGGRWEKTERSLVRSPSLLGSKVFDEASGAPVVVPYTLTGARASMLVAGGSPPSLWMHLGGGALGQRWSAFLARMPVLSPVAEDAYSRLGPAAVWTTDARGAGRLWLVGGPRAGLAYRVRDNGIWSDWHRLPQLPGGRAYALAAAAVPDGIWVFVTGRGGRVYATRATRADCAPGDCRWVPFRRIPGAATPFAPAAVADPAGELHLVLSRADGSVTRQTSRGRHWSAARWETSDAGAGGSAPSVAWVDGRAWVAVRDPAGDIRVLGSDGWEVVRGHRGGEDSSLEPDWCGGGWGTAPEIVFDGTRVRVFAGQARWPKATCESTRGSDGWTPWRRIRTWARTISRPAAARVGREVHLVTRSTDGRLMQQALE